MKFTLLNTVAAFFALFGWKEIPIDAGNQTMKLDAEQKQKIFDALGEKLGQDAIDGINNEIKNLQNNNLDLKAIQDELDAMVKEANLTDEELKNIAKDEKGDLKMTSQIQALTAKLKEKDTLITKLMTDSEPDVPNRIIQMFGNRNSKIEHSATHAFASGKDYDAFDKRNWNKRLLDSNLKATDFNESGAVPLLQTDLEHFVNENSGQLTSLFNDFTDLPAEWDRRTGVLDKVSDGFIIPGEIVQGRQKGYNPKNKFKIDSEQGQVFRKKIDITFDGYELQKIENTWIRGYNKEGSSPWKMSFIGFLLGELIKRQALDDRIAQVNGIYVQTPEDMAGMAVNSQNGLRYLWYHYRDVAKKYKAADIGKPTEENIVDYIETLIKTIPEIERNEAGLEIQLSNYWMKAYQKRAGELYQLHFSTDQGSQNYTKPYPVNYPNFKFQPLIDQNNTDFIGITKSNNIQILDYNVSEKTRFTITHEKRDTHIFADYRLGIRFIYVGMKLEPGDPREFELQKVWSNNVPIFEESVKVPAFDDTTGVIKVTYPKIAITDAWKTNVTNIEGATKGSVIKITGNTGLIAAKNVVSNANLLLGSDFDLSTGGTLTLYAQEDGKFKELNRTSAPEAKKSTDVNFTTAIVDVVTGTIFRYTGSATKAITSLINGVENKTIRIYGTDAAGVDVTLSDTGNINVVSAATLGGSNDYVQLTQVDGTWIETGRSITA